MGIESWSTTPASNNSAPPDGAPEGMLAGKVNDVMRQIMADVRSWFESDAWTNLGYTHTYGSATTFTIAADVTTTYHANRRVRAVGSLTGTIYGTISSSSYSAPNTTVTVVWDSGSLSNETLTVSLAFYDATNKTAHIDGIAGAGDAAAGTIGADVQAYDADTAKTDEDQSWTGSQRATPVTDNDGSFDMDEGQNFNWTPSGADTLEFTNETAGQSGLIYLDNSSGHAITLGSEIEADGAAASTLSTAGKYLIGYYSPDGTAVAISYTGALS